MLFYNYKNVFEIAKGKREKIGRFLNFWKKSCDEQRIFFENLQKRFRKLTGRKFTGISVCTKIIFKEEIFNERKTYCKRFISVYDRRAAGRMRRKYCPDFGGGLPILM